MTVTVEPYGTKYAAASHALWTATLPTWPLGLPAFTKTAQHGLVALEHGRLVGLALTDLSPADATGLALLVVAPGARRAGLGTMLHDAVIDRLLQGGPRQIKLGGGREYFWPGIPKDLTNAAEFFRQRGWNFTEVSWDLVADLRTYRAPGSFEQRAANAEVTVRVAGTNDFSSVIEFEEEHFPQWVDYYRSALDTDRLVIAVDDMGHVAGAAILSYPGDGHTLWSSLVGPGTGGIGAVGVAASMRELGVGTALVSRACDVPRAAGATRCHAGWTDLLTFYGRLGFRPWREYDMASRTL